MANKEYLIYLKSAEWKLKRKQLFNERGKKCERCGATKKLQVHHVTYKRIFNEALEDLEVLCKPCHQKEHNIKTKKKRKPKNKKRPKTGHTKMNIELLRMIKYK